jgi:anhydro-N-acetylmuramic acid kinase
MRVLGLSSGTSHDGIDAALVEFDLEGETLHARLLKHETVPYPAALREEILAALPPKRVGLDAVCRLDTRIGQAFADAAQAVLSGAEAGLIWAGDNPPAGLIRQERPDEAGQGRNWAGDNPPAGPIRQERPPPAHLICSHGQTMYHWPGQGTLQLGQAAWIAERTGLPVVSDVRARDIAAGGQGAPLVPILDLLLLAGFPGRPGALNLGGIANLTVYKGPMAYDVGPGNALLDAAALHFTGTPCDRDGRLAAQGRIQPQLLEKLLDEPYYKQRPPKSTGKELFHPGYLDGLIDALPGADVLATLVELTAVTVAAEIRHHELDTVLVSGGGIHNGFLMQRLAEAVGPARLMPSDAVGVPVDAKEAVLFALIGWLTAHGLAGSVAACTGARNASILGSVTGPLVPRAATMPARLVMA